jgi:hypothetical protein
MNHEATFVYFFKADKQQEVIGNVLASNRKEALLKISIIKQLPVDDIDRLFVVKQKKEKS